MALLQDELFALEERFWTSGPEFFHERLAPGAVMVFPDPPGVLVRDEIADSIDEKRRWRQVTLEEHRVLELDPGAAIVTYKATARRDDELYVVRASSAYVKDGGGWRLAFHQQTPLIPAPA